MRASRDAICEFCWVSFPVKSGAAGRFCSRVCANRRFHSPEIIAALRAEWDTGISAGRLAKWATEEFGRKFTKNVISGITHRNDFSARPSPVRQVPT